MVVGGDDDGELELIYVSFKIHLSSKLILRPSSRESKSILESLVWVKSWARWWWRVFYCTCTQARGKGHLIKFHEVNKHIDRHQPNRLFVVFKKEQHQPIRQYFTVKLRCNNIMHTTHTLMTMLWWWIFFYASMSCSAKGGSLKIHFQFRCLSTNKHYITFSVLKWMF